MLDLIIFLYILWLAGKGFTSTPSKQFSALLLRLLIIAALSGFFLITQLTGLIKSSVEVITAQSGVLITLLSFVTALLLLLQLRSKVIDRLDILVPKQYHPVAGAGIALLRSLLMSGLLVVILKHFPLSIFDSLLENSMIATTLFRQ